MSTWLSVGGASVSSPAHAACHMTPTRAFRSTAAPHLIRYGPQHCPISTRSLLRAERTSVPVRPTDTGQSHALGGHLPPSRQFHVIAIGSLEIHTSISSFFPILQPRTYPGRMRFGGSACGLMIRVLSYRTLFTLCALCVYPCRPRYQTDRLSAHTLCHNDLQTLRRLLALLVRAATPRR